MTNDTKDLAVRPPWTEEERDLWLDLFSQYSLALLPSTDEDGYIDARKERRNRQAQEAVILGAQLADIAITEYQFRLFTQRREIASDATPAAQFEEFTAWMGKRMPIGKRRVAKKRIQHKGMS